MSWVLLSTSFAQAQRLAREPLGPSGRRTGIAISEIHYHPAPRSDGLQVQFLELYNSNPFQEDLSGWTINGDIQFTFPSNSIVLGNGFLVIAKKPGDVESAYSIANVAGPWKGDLPTGAGHLQLRKTSGGIVLELNYSNQWPWPMAADGYGPSLVLGRPTYGEASPDAWVSSFYDGGSPGKVDPYDPSGADAVVVNEVLLRPGASSGNAAFVEFYNPSSTEADLSGVELSLGSSTNRYLIPSGTRIPSGRFWTLDFSNTSLSPRLTGDALFLSLSGDLGVHFIDAIPLDVQAVDQSVGLYPDGVGRLRRLSLPSPGARNPWPSPPEVVINEIFYKPPTDVPNSEFIELWNSGDHAVELSGWRFIAGVDFVFPVGTFLRSGQYIVVAKDPQQLLTNHPELDANQVFGPFTGGLAGRGETLILARPEAFVIEGKPAQGWVKMDEVTYARGGTWPSEADGGGSSLELLNPLSDHLLGSSWGASDETQKSDWNTVEYSGVLDQPHPSTATADQVQLILFGAGQALVDDVEVLVNGQNRVRNPSFETNSLNWVGQGTHRTTFWETNSGYGSGHSLHLVATDRGDQVANRVRGALGPAIAINTPVTLRARVRWLSGNPDFLFRLRSGMIEAATRLTIPKNLGTPGAPNSRSKPIVGPAIFNVTHSPVFPSTNVPIRITALVIDPRGVGSVTLQYRVDPTNTFTEVPMRDDGQSPDLIAGDHLFTAEIPGQKSGKMVAFKVKAVDGVQSGLTSVFPVGGVKNEALVRIGEITPKGNFGTYHLWVTSSNINAWTRREKMSNEGLDATFVYGTNRVIYNVAARYAGSYYSVGGYDGPTGALCGYDVTFPEDQTLLGEDHFTLDWPIRDDTDQREQLMFWFCEQYGLPNLYRRYVNLYVNGNHRGTIYDDVQQPDGTTLKEFFPNDSDGMLLKTDCWDEFADNGDPIGGLACQLNSLDEFVTPDGEKKTSRYRWNWRPRAVKSSAHDYKDFYELVDAVNAPDGEPLIRAVRSVVDVNHWMTTFAMNDLASYWDGFGNPNAKNTYLYKPTQDGWKLYSWDFDVGLGVYNDPFDAPLFPGLNDVNIMRIYATPALVRPYWTAMAEGLNTFFLSGKGTPVNAILDSKFAAFKTNGIPLADPAGIKSWIVDRRKFLLTELKKVSAAFTISTHQGGDFSQTTNQVWLSGTAGVTVADITVNGKRVPIQWTTVTNWTLNCVLEQGVNHLVVEGRNRKGGLVDGASKSINITCTDAVDSPAGHLVINEIQYQAAYPDSEFIELYNVSSSTAFDVSGWRIQGVDFEFPEGSHVSPGGFLVVAKSALGFGRAYGWQIPVAGTYQGNLKATGETLQIIRPADAGHDSSVIDSVSFRSDAPWPSGPTQVGMSLQLIDPRVDHDRVSNWAAGSGPVSMSLSQSIALTNVWRFQDSGEDPGAKWFDFGFQDQNWSSGPGVFYNSPDALLLPRNTLIQLTNAAAGKRVITHYFRTSFDLPLDPGTTEIRLGIVADDGVAFYLNGQELVRKRLPSGVLTPTRLASTTVGKATLEPPVSFVTTALKAGENLLAAEVHQSTTNNNDVVFGANFYWKQRGNAGATPGAPNVFSRSLPAFPSIRLTEVQPENQTGPQDRLGHRSAWVEIHNSSSQPQALENLYLSDSLGSLLQWKFPIGAVLGANEFHLIWLDGDASLTSAGEWHVGFRIPAGSGEVYLSRVVEGEPQILDYLVYSQVPPDASYGKFPSDSTGRDQVFDFPTAGAENSNRVRPVPVWINEWMASNGHTLADPADGQFDDWFELYNPNETRVDLTDFTLTDDPKSPTKFKIPSGFGIPAHGYLLVWADNQTGQSSVDGDLHVNFKLSGGGESLALFASDGTKIDAVTFGNQTTDVSGGRFPDGAAAPFLAFHHPTPRASNQSDASFHPPIQILDITPTAGAPGSIQITWSSQPGNQYILQTRDALVDGASWREVTRVTAQGTSVQGQDLAPGAAVGQRFYRVLLSP